MSIEYPIVRLQNLINEPTNIIFLLQNSAENQIRFEGVGR